MFICADTIFEGGFTAFFTHFVEKPYDYQFHKSNLQMLWNKNNDHWEIAIFL